jgi:hypothetical protein
MPKQTPKVFQLNDCEWYAGYDLESVKAHYAEVCSFDVDELAEYTLDAEIVDDETMERLRFHYNLDGEDADVSRDATHSFAEELAQLIAAGVPFPRFFATTEF